MQPLQLKFSKTEEEAAAEDEAYQQRFLLLRFSSLGDVVLATAAASYLKAKRPKSHVIFVTKALYAPLLQGHPAIDEVWALGGKQGLWDIIGRARGSALTAVLDLHGNLRGRLLGFFSGFPEGRWQAGTLDRRLRVWFKGWKRPLLPPVVQRYVAMIAEALAEPLPAPMTLPSLVVAPEAGAWAQDWLKAQGWKGERLVVAAPGAAWPSKRTSVDIFRASLQHLPSGVRVLLVGSAAEKGLCDEVAAGLHGAINAAGQSADMQQLLALVSQGAAFLGHDSGPLHLAEALGIPCTALFGPTVKDFGFFPQGPGHRVFEMDLDCRPCSVHGTQACPLGHHHCLLQLDPAAIARHLAQVLTLKPA